MPLDSGFKQENEGPSSSLSDFETSDMPQGQTAEEEGAALWAKVKEVFPESLIPPPP